MNPHDPNAPAILAPGREPLTYAQLARQVDEIADALRGLGIRRTDRVALVLPNGPDLAVALIGISTAAVAAPLNPEYKLREFDALLADLDARAVVTLPGSDSPVVQAARARGIAVVEWVEGRPVGDSRRCDGPFGDHSLDETRFVVFTSGTTSRPKAVPLTGANLQAWSRNFREAVALTAADRCLNMVPLFHAQGLAGSVLIPLDAGGSAVCTPGFQAASFAGWLSEFKPTWYTAGPTLHQAILEKALGSAPPHRLRFIRSISAALTPSLMADLEKAFGAPVLEGYGMTETGTITSNPFPPRPRKPGSVGVAVGPELAILDALGIPVAPGAMGEIATRGPGIMGGYENNPQANHDAFIRGWFRTGDLGRLDEDGYLYITGRVKELINRAGEKVSPGEVEEVLASHSSVAQAVVFAMPHPKLGEEVAAAVVTRDGAAAPARELQRFVADRLAPFKVPRKILTLKELPKGPTGKVQRIGLAQKLGITAESLRPEFVAPRSAGEVYMAALWKRILCVKDVGIDDSFFDLGGDSLMAAQLFSDIEEATGKKLPLTAIMEAPTLRQLVDVLESGSAPAWPSLVPIQEGRSRLPFFCVHGVYGNVVGFRVLASALGADQTFYGLQAQGLDGVEPPLERVEDMAHRYLREALAVQASGPYLLGGWSFGGLVALEMARQLLGMGRKVGLLVILDSRKLLLPRSALPDEAAFVEDMPAEVAAQPAATTQDRLRDRLREARRIGLSPFSPAYRARGKIEMACMRAMWAYAARPFAGRIHLVWTTRSGYDDADVNRDAWERIAEGGLECFELAANHPSVMQEPHVHDVAAKLKDWIAEVR